MKKYMLGSVTIFFLLIYLLAPVGASLAAQLNTTVQSSSLQYGEGPTDPVELEAFLTSMMKEKMDEYQVAGGVVSVVKDGELLFARGYGLADVAANKPVNAETTIFSIGSISKVFTFTAVMQLVEQGKIDLDADINTYLDFKIPDTYPEPITMAHLMSHSAGLDEFFFGTAGQTAEDILPLGEFLRTRLPPRVRPPGVAQAYSSYGVTLAGYIVERVSGQPYADYVEEHIFRPLGMDRTSARISLPGSLSQDMSLTYEYRDGAFQSVKDALFYLHGVPAGSIKSTATDMARFMIAHLEEGAFQDARILQAETARLMHTRHFVQDPRLKGWAHGFYEIQLENPRVIGHGGDTIYFHTKIGLAPEAGLGIFVAINSDTDGKKMVESVVDAFFNHYFSIAITPPAPLANSTTDLSALEGSYAIASASYGTWEKLRFVLMITKVQAQEDGSLLLSSLAGSQRYLEVEPLLFQRDDGKHIDYLDHISFKIDSNGKVQYLLANAIDFQKLPWYETMEFSLLHSAILLLLFLSVPIVAIIWRASPRLREQAARQPRGARLARLVLGWMVVLYFISTGGMFSAFATQDAVLYGNAVAFIVGNYLAIPVALLAVVAAFCAVLAWRQGYWSLAWRIHYTLVALAGVSVVWWYFNWKVIG